jgi:hypothetical protein
VRLDSAAEKAVARNAFDRALNKDLQDLVREVKEMASRRSRDLRAVERRKLVAERRRELDGKYDYHYSVLPSASAALVKQELISEKDLHGLSAERSDLIVVG